MSSIFTCPRCVYSAPREADMRFCPRCGLPDDNSTAQDEPFDLTIAGKLVTVKTRLAFGGICNLYRASVQRLPWEGVLKIARTHQANTHLAREADVLKRLRAADASGRFAPFLPSLVGSINYAHAGGEPPRQANMLAYSSGIAGPDELYTLDEVRSAYPAGVDPRDMAWMWRRLLTILGFIHQQRIAHGGVTPDHVLIEPKEHKLVLIGWCGAVAFGAQPVLRPARWQEWHSASSAASAAADLASAARTMSHIMGTVSEPAIARHLERAAGSSEAWKLLDDFDRMIEAMWGPRRFRAFSMPSRVV